MTSVRFYHENIQYNLRNNNVNKQLIKLLETGLTKIILK